MLRTRRTQVHNHGLCAHSGWGQPTRQNSAEIRRHDRRLACHGKLADGTRSDAWAMESTGVYWRPVWNILEGQFTWVLANAQHVKNVPGARRTRKTASGWPNGSSADG